MTNLLSSVRALYDGFEWAIIFYVSGINAVYFLLMVLGFFALRSYRARQTPETRDALLNSPLLPEVSIIMPAHNEAVTISQSVRSMLNLNYPKFEVVRPLLVPSGPSIGRATRYALSWWIRRTAARQMRSTRD